MQILEIIVFFTFVFYYSISIFYIAGTAFFKKGRVLRDFHPEDQLSLAKLYLPSRATIALEMATLVKIRNKRRGPSGRRSSLGSALVQCTSLSLSLCVLCACYRQSPRAESLTPFFSSPLTENFVSGSKIPGRPRSRLQSTTKSLLPNFPQRKIKR